MITIIIIINISPRRQRAPACETVGADGDVAHPRSISILYYSILLYITAYDIILCYIILYYCIVSRVHCVGSIADPGERAHVAHVVVRHAAAAVHEDNRASGVSR